MFTLPDKTMVVFDLETTDISMADAAGVLPEIAEVGAVRISSDFQVLGQFSSLVQPRNPESWTDFSEHLTGITRQDLANAPPWKEVWKGFCEFTNYQASRMASWSISFDYPVLRAAYRRERLGFPHSKTGIDLPSLLYGFVAIWGLDLGGWSLEKACSRFGVERRRKHRALPDCLDAVAVLQAVSVFGD